MKQFLLVFTLIFSLQGFAQEDYMDCTITFVNDSIKNGKCTIPKLPSDNGIYFKYKNDKRKYLTGNDVQRLVVKKKGNKHIFDLLPVGIYKKRQDGIVLKKRKYWLYLEFSGENMSTYVTSQTYKLDRRGKMHLTSYSSRSGNHPIVFYLKKKSDNYAYYVLDFRSNDANQRSFDKSIYYYLKDDPKFYQLIKKKQIKWERINEIPVYYTWYLNQVNRSD